MEHLLGTETQGLYQDRTNQADQEWTSGNRPTDCKGQKRTSQTKGEEFLNDDELIDAVANLWISNGGDAEDFIYCWRFIQEAIEEKLKERDGE